jgi:hypothetical protein
MSRPDQDRFEQFSRHFEAIDAEVETFSAEHRMHLDKNLLRQPGRVLRKKGNPEYLIDISLSGHWLKLPFSVDLPHTVSVIAYFEPTDGQFIWRMYSDLVRNEPFSVLRKNLPDYLTGAMKLIAQWSPEIILRDGDRMPNLKKKYATD